MSLKNSIKDIKALLDNNNILTTQEECYCYSVDSSNIITANKIPDLVVFAETIEDVQKTVKYAYEHEIPIISRGAGTNMVGSCVSNEGGIVLNFSKMNKIIDINTDNLTAVVQPGVIVGDLKKAAESNNLFFPPDPSNYAVSTIGGAIAQSSGGANSFKYGTTKDYVLSLKVIMSDGTLVTLGFSTAKDATGYHLSQLMVGSEGTLGVIVEATLKLIPLPESKCAISAYFDNLEAGMKTVNKIIKGQVFPAAIDFMDKRSVSAVDDYLKLGLKTEKECLLLITLDGNLASIQSQTETVQKLLSESSADNIKVSRNDEEFEKIWMARRVAFAAAARLAPDVVTDDIIVPRENLSEMVIKCHNIADKYGLNICMVGHAGDGNIHPQIALNLDSETEFKNYMDAKSEMYSEAIRLGGSISAEHGIGLEKKDYMTETVDKNALEYMKLIKKVFDPKNILNPGKIF